MTTSDTPMTVVARLYTVQRGSKTIRRASVLNGEGEPLVRLSDAERALTAEREKNAEATETLQFVERWANHHGQKDCIGPAEALSCIQHYPPILAITRGYVDGKVPETPNPWAMLEAERQKNAKLRDEVLEEAAKEIDCGCDCRGNVLMAFHHNNRHAGGMFCKAAGSNCAALDAQAIRAMKKSNER